MNATDQIKLFMLNNLAVEAELKKVEKAVGFQIRAPEKVEDKDEEFYPQFPEHIRREAEEMARHYEIFYCLETSIRQLISDRLKEELGPDWWEKGVPEQIRNNAETNRKREAEMGMTPRSDDMIDFTTFGELGQIISANAAIIGDTFRDLKAAGSDIFEQSSCADRTLLSPRGGRGEPTSHQLEGLVPSNGVTRRQFLCERCPIARDRPYYPTPSATGEPCRDRSTGIASSI